MLNKSDMLSFFNTYTKNLLFFHTHTKMSLFFNIARLNVPYCGNLVLETTGGTNRVYKNGTGD